MSKEPGPDHPITVGPASGRVRVRVGDQVVADSGRALVLREADYPPVFYLPRADVSMDRLAASDKRTWCPYKGEAAYFGVRTNGRLIEDAVWTYDPASPAVAGITGYLAFYPSKVDAIETEPV
ncbi:MAG: DUF427 domain-containing protein [Geminicoccaceae bacterium]|nr:DUF427 domain-containing protein [Geminicoccaceae bacterium]